MKILKKKSHLNLDKTIKGFYSPSKKNKNLKCEDFFYRICRPYKECNIFKRKDIFVMSSKICLSDQITHVYVISVQRFLTYVVPHHGKMS